jgi:hypothetical protein
MQNVASSVSVPLTTVPQADRLLHAKLMDDKVTDDKVTGTCVHWCRDRLPRRGSDAFGLGLFSGKQRFPSVGRVSVLYNHCRADFPVCPNTRASSTDF